VSDSSGVSVEKQLLKQSETALFCGVSQSTILRWEAAGDFPRRRRLGPNRVAWLREELEEWIASREPVSAKATDAGAREASNPKGQEPDLGRLGDHSEREPRPDPVRHLEGTRSGPDERRAIQ